MCNGGVTILLVMSHEIAIADYVRTFELCFGSSAVADPVTIALDLGAAEIAVFGSRHTRRYTLRLTHGWEVFGLRDVVWSLRGSNLRMKNDVISHTIQYTSEVCAAWEDIGKTW
jgi:hypothetical protein